MRQFASSGFRIWNLSMEAKLVYTAFGLFSLAALIVSALFYEDLVGTSTSGVRAYYAGESGAAAGSPPKGPAAGDGPQIDLPDEAAAPPAAMQQKLTVAVTYRKLLEVTHFHLFTVPVFLLIIAHLFMLTGLSTRAKVGWIAGGWGSALVHLAAPWLVRYGGGGWSWSYAWSGAALGLTCGVMTLWPIGSMWLGKPRRAAQGKPPADESIAD